MVNKSTADYLFYFKIVVKDEKHRQIKAIVWKDLPFHIRTKYNWYFEYRAALLKVQNPKYNISTSFGKYEPETASGIEKVLKKKTNLLTARKRKITQTRNKIAQAKENWNEIFEIESSPLYLKACNKLNRLVKERDELETEIQKLKNNL